MAQQTLDFIIAQQVTGQAEVAKLIKSVGALDAEMKRLRAATAGIEGGFGRASQAVRGNTNVLDAQSKALRNSRQGMQQAGMQVNDFVTSVSTGASPVQAFNQQIGQLGYAMSLMGGKASAVGRFLAGPWSIAVIGASMVLGPMIEKFITGGDEAENAADKISQIAFASDATATAQGILGNVMDITTGKMRTQSEAAINLARAQLEVERVNSRIRAQQATRTLETAAQRRVKVGEIDLGRGVSRREALAAGATVSTMRPTVSAAEAARALRGEVNTALDNLRALNDAGKITDERFAEIAAAAANLGVELENVKVLGEALDALSGDSGALGQFLKPAKETSEAVREVKSEMDRFVESVNRVDNRMQLAREAFLAGKISAAQYRAEIERAEKAQRNFGVSDKTIQVLREGAKPIDIFKDQFNLSPLEQLQIETKAILDQAEQIQRSYDAVGQAVADGFKGMITGAQSFGDAMKGIIQSVIDELFRLFVVQQIVGFVSKTLGNAFGAPSPTNLLPAGYATGGYPAPGKPVMVGERGPELFVPTGSGKIIPNHQLSGGGGGMVINVDARGATSPEMVRQQVQQGILEAAPSIVAAAEQRTITTLRRPRLAGAL